MRRYIEIVENAQQNSSSEFLAEIRKWMRFITSSIPAPPDEELAEFVSEKMQEIDFHASAGSEYLIERIELRPRNQLQNLGSVGCHWSWEDGAAAAYHHDNARDAHDGKLVEIRLVARASDDSIDWPYTLATNFIHPGESEITVKSGAQITLEAIWMDGEEHEVNQTVTVSGSYNTR